MDSSLPVRKDGGSAHDPLWEEAREIFNQGFGRSKRPKVDDTTRLEDTIKTLKLVQSKVSNEYGTHTLHKGSKEIEINVGRIMRRLELILQVGDAAMEFGPETVSLVWSAFRMVFTVCLSVCYFHRGLADHIHHLGFSQGFGFLRFPVGFRRSDLRHVIRRPDICRTIFPDQGSGRRL